MIADINIEDINLSNPLGIELIKVSIVTQGDTLAYVKSLIVDAELMELTKGKALVNNLIINEPRIKLLRSKKDSTWNYNHLMKPSPPTDSEGTSEFVIDLKKCLIENGSFMYIDSVEADWNSENIAYDRMHFDSLNIDISAYVEIHNNLFEAKINNLSARETFSDFTLNKLSAETKLSPDIIQTEKLTAITENNEFFVECTISNYDVFGIGGNDKIENAVFDIEAFANDVDDEEIHNFAQIPIEINEIDEVYLKADGTLNELKVSDANVNSNNSEFNFEVLVKNLIDFDNFSYTADFNRSNIKTRDINSLLPDIDLSSIFNISQISINRLRVTGNEDSTTANFDFTTNIGKISGYSSVNWQSDLYYRADLNVIGLDAISFVDNSTKSNLNGSIKFEGSGTNPYDMNTKLDIRLTRSEYDFMSVKNLAINAEIKKGGLVKIDSIKVGFSKDSTDIYFDPNIPSKMIFQGFVNLTKEAYGISSEFSDIDLRRIMKSKSLPNNLTGNINVSGSGLNIDSIRGLANINIESGSFNDRSIMPMSITAKAYDHLYGEKILSVESDYVDIKLTGSYSIPELFDHIATNGQSISNFFNDKFKLFNKQEQIAIDETNGPFPNLNCRIEADIKNISLVSSFIDDFNIDSKVGIAANIKSDSAESTFHINKFDMEYFDLQSGDFYINTDKLIVSGLLEFDANNVSSVRSIGLDLNSDDYIDLGGILLDSNEIHLDFVNNTFNLFVNTKLNDIVNIKLTNKGEFKTNNISNTIDQIALHYDNKFNFYNSENIFINIDDNSISVENLNLERLNSEKIRADFKLVDDEISSNLDISRIDLSQYLYLFDEGLYEQLRSLEGVVDDLNINIGGKTTAPNISIDINGSDFSFNNEKLGNLISSLKLHDSNLKGHLKFLLKDKSELINVNLKSVPTTFSLKNYTFEFIEEEPFSATVNIPKLPLAVAEPFISGVSELQGNTKIQIIFGGNLPDKVNYRGKLFFNDVSLRSDFNNMSYKADANLELDKTGLEINSFVLRNRAYDLPQGQANITGRIDLDNFDIKNFDLRLHSNKLKLLSNESKKALPNIYGDLIIGTGNDPMYFTGSIDEPDFRGQIELLKADLFMPQMQAGTEQRSRLIYVTKEELEERYEETDDGALAQLNNGHTSKSFLDLLNIDVKIDLKSNLKLKMDLNPTTSINADINTKKNSPPIRFIKDRDQADTEFFAQLHLYDKSHLNFIKSFKTTGDINFPTGSLTQPYLDLTASYEGKTNIDNEIRKYEVLIMIKGSVEKPDISFTYLIDDVEAYGDQSEIERDAIMLLLTGRTNREMSGGESTAINPGLIGEQTGLSLIETQLSKSLTEMLLNTGFVESADVNIGSGDIENVTVELSGQIDFIGDWEWTVGGNLSDFTKHFITVSTPLGSLLNYNALNNVVIEMSRSVSEQISQTQDQKEWEVKVKLNNIVW